jgi:hypothetical protein
MKASPILDDEGGDVRLFVLHRLEVIVLVDEAGREPRKASPWTRPMPLQVPLDCRFSGTLVTSTIIRVCHEILLDGGRLVYQLLRNEFSLEFLHGGLVLFHVKRVAIRFAGI